MTKTLVRATFAAILLSFFSLNHVTHAQKAADEKPQTGLPKITLYAGGQTIHADVAATEGARQIGLMFRKQMGKNEGMMFVFPLLAYHAMWMKNTLIPLSVAYMDDNGKILSIQTAAEITLDAATLDRIDEIVPPGTTISAGDMGYQPPALAEPRLRRRA